MPIPQVEKVTRALLWLKTQWPLVSAEGWLSADRRKWIAGLSNGAFDLSVPELISAMCASHSVSIVWCAGAKVIHFSADDHRIRKLDACHVSIASVRYCAILITTCIWHSFVIPTSYAEQSPVGCNARQALVFFQPYTVVLLLE